MRFRSLFVIVLAVLVAAPVAATAQTRRRPGRRAATTTTAQPSAGEQPSAGSRALTIGGTIGVELGDLDGFALRVDGEMPIKPLTPKISLSGVGSVGYSRLGMDIPGGDITWNIFKVIPAARFTMPVAPQISLYGDAGLGLYYGSWSSKASLFGVTLEASDSTVGFLMRFGVGGLYELNPKTKLSAEISLLPYFGDADTTNWTLGVGAIFAL